MTARRVVCVRVQTVELVKVSFHGRQIPLYRALAELGCLTVIDNDEPLERQEKRR